MPAMTRPRELIDSDLSGILLEQAGISVDDLAALAPGLTRARREILHRDGSSPAAGELLPADCPPTAAVLELPERILDEYVDDRQHSRLGRILATAGRLRETVDRVVVLGPASCCRGGRALQRACCEPYFNELSRSQRGSRPRMYFVDQHLDNDAASGLVELLTAGRSPLRLEDRWAIVAIGGDGEGHLPALGLRQLLPVLCRFVGGDSGKLAQLVIPIGGASGPLCEVVQAISCRERHEIPAAVGERFSIFSPAGLLPAAILGLDVVRLLEGASAMSDRFRTAPPGANPALDLAGANLLVQQKHPAAVRVLQVWSQSLEAVGRWYAPLCAWAGEPDGGRVALTAVCPRDLLGGPAWPLDPGQQLLIRIVVEQCRCDPWHVGCCGQREAGQEAGGKPLQAGGEPLPQLLAAALRETRAADRAAGRPAVEIGVPRIDEYTLGQLLQMLMLASVLEVTPRRTPSCQLN